MRLIPIVLLALALVACATAPPPRADAGWQALFDGKTLTGWSAPDLSYFRVEDGAITGETTKEHNPPRNQFIVWQGGEVADFEVSFEFRIFGPASNSGLQFRSQVKEHGLVHGYQADIDGKAKFFGGIWDEYGTRKSLSARGQHTVIAVDGSRTVKPIAEAATLEGLKLDQWTRYHVTAIGPRIELRINGVLATVLEDHETGKAAASGVLAMPIIPGEPMKVQYRDVRLKRR
jgi:Domain of Unknown Function (DUF1080)